MVENKFLVVSPVNWTVKLEDGILPPMDSLFPRLIDRLNDLSIKGWNINKVESVSIQVQFSKIDPQITVNNDDKEKKDYLLFFLIKN